MGLTSQNYKEVRERLRKMLDQKAALKSKAAAAATPPVQGKQATGSGKSAASGSKTSTPQQAAPSPTPNAG